MTKKMGRPLKGSEKRDKRIEFRLTETEMTLINDTAKKARLTRVDLVVQAVKALAERLGK